MGKNLLDLFLMETRSSSGKEVGLKIVNESYLLVISFVLFIETLVSPPRPAQSQRLVKEGEIILFLKPIQGYGSSKPIFFFFALSSFCSSLKVILPVLWLHGGE